MIVMLFVGKCASKLFGVPVHEKSCGGRGRYQSVFWIAADEIVLSLVMLDIHAVKQTQLSRQDGVWLSLGHGVLLDVTLPGLVRDRLDRADWKAMVAWRPFGLCGSRLTSCQNICVGVSGSVLVLLHLDQLGDVAFEFVGGIGRMGTLPGLVMDGLDWTWDGTGTIVGRSFVVVGVGLRSRRTLNKGWDELGIGDCVRGGVWDGFGDGFRHGFRHGFGLGFANLEMTLPGFVRDRVKRTWAAPDWCRAVAWGVLRRKSQNGRAGEEGDGDECEELHREDEVLMRTKAGS